MDKLKIDKQTIVLILAIIACIAGFFVFSKLNAVSSGEKITMSSKSEGTEEKKEEEEKENANFIRVDVAGCVEKSGVYKLENGSIVEDALKKAGGLSKCADFTYVAESINRAKTLEDGEKVYIPKKGAVIASTATSEENSTFASEEEDVESISTSSEAASSSKVNINTAGIEELDSLPGIGEAYAQRIIDARPFNSIDEIQNVSGIGPVTYEKIMDMIEV